MIRNRIRAWYAAMLLGLTVGVSPALTDNAAALNLRLVEFGEGLNSTVSLFARGFGSFPGDVQQLVAPSGDVFDAQSGLETAHFARPLGSRLRDFNTLEGAARYVSGNWNATVITRFFPSVETAVTDVTISDLSAVAIDRTPPTLLSPVPGQVIENGSTFLFAWDYLGTDTPPRGSVITYVPQFDPITGWSGTGVVTPVPGETWTSGTGANEFVQSITNVPDTDKNRFLNTIRTYETVLPLDVQLTLGSSVNLTSEIMPADPELFRFGGPTLGYSRMNDPFFITLAAVPEPTSGGLLMLAGLVALVKRRNGARESLLARQSVANSLPASANS